VFQTLRVVWDVESESLDKRTALGKWKGTNKWKYYFTVNDIGSCALGRNMVFLLLLEEVADAV
jgi:hypothetical protein